MNLSLFTVAEVAEIIKVRRETIRRYIKKGYLAAILLPGGDYRIHESELKAFTSRRTGSKGHDNYESR